jgi:8-oxo-dGTP diphosphatase
VTAATAERRLIHVAAGVISDDQGRVLIAKRPDHTHQGGLWEFPGGKLEPDEPVEDGLARELAEEIGIRVLSSRPLIRLAHDYGDRGVLLEIRRVLAYRGTPQGREGQALAWTAPDAMDPSRFPAADRPVISALRLPTRYLITGAEPRAPDAFVAHLEQVLAATGVGMVQLRAPWLDDDAYGELAKRCAERCHRAGARLILNCAPGLAEDLPGDGLHLTEARLLTLSERPRLGSRLVGASCHAADTLAKTADLGLDYALLSPVQTTASHPHATPLGWRHFAELVDAACVPVYALGGVGDTELETAIGHGAQGIAAIRAFWSRTRARAKAS